MLKAHSNSPQAVYIPKNSALRKRKAVVALDIDGDVLRVAQASGQGAAAKIVRIANGKLQLLPDKKEDAAHVGVAIKKALDSLRLSVKEAALTLRRGNAVLRPLQVPMPDDPRELAAIVNFQIAKELPFRIEDAVVDFKVLRQVEVAATPASGATDPAGAAAVPLPGKRLDLLVGAVKADVVQFYRDVAKAAGFKLAALGLRSIAVAHCAARCGGTEAAVLLISIGNEEITIDVSLEGKLVFSRVAALPTATPEAPADAASIQQSLQIEVVRSLHSYEGVAGFQPVQRLLVSGGTGVEQAVADSLADRLKVPGAVLNPADCLSGKTAAPEETAGSAAAIGLALSALDTAGLPIDFATPKKPTAPRNTQRTQLLVAAAAGLVVLITLFGVRARLVKKRLKVREEVQAQLTDAEKKLPIYRRLKSQAKVVNGWIGEDQNWLDHLAYLTAVLPGAEDIYISAFTTSPQHVIRFSVQARTGELLAELDKKLRAAGYEVRPLSITPASDKHGYNFRTTVELNIPKKMKPDFAKTKPPARPADDASLKATSNNKQAGQKPS